MPDDTATPPAGYESAVAHILAAALFGTPARIFGWVSRWCTTCLSATSDPAAHVHLLLYSIVAMPVRVRVMRDRLCVFHDRMEIPRAALGPDEARCLIYLVENHERSFQARTWDHARGAFVFSKFYYDHLFETEIDRAEVLRVAIDYLLLVCMCRGGEGFYRMRMAILASLDQIHLHTTNLDYLNLFYEFYAHPGQFARISDMLTAHTVWSDTRHRRESVLRGAALLYNAHRVSAGGATSMRGLLSALTGGTPPPDRMRQLVDWAGVPRLSIDTAETPEKPAPGA